MTTTFELDRIGERPRGDAPLAAEYLLGEIAREQRIEDNRQRLASVVLVSSDDLIESGMGRTIVDRLATIDQALDLLGGPVPGDLRKLVSIFDVAPADELRALRPYLAVMAAADDSPPARRRRALRAFDVAVRRCIPAVLRSHGCREFSTELERLSPLDERSLATAERLLGVVEVQIDRRIDEWFGASADVAADALALLQVRDELVGGARRYAEALRTQSFEALGAWEGPGFALAAAGLSVGWDEISCWEFFGPVLGLHVRPEPIDAPVS